MREMRARSVIERVAESGCITRESRQDKTRVDEMRGDETRDEHKLGEFRDCCVLTRGNRCGMNNVS